MELLKKLVKKRTNLVWPVLLVVAGVTLKMTLFAPLPVRAVTIERRDLTAQAYGHGTVEAKVVVAVSSKITGRIVELYADQGDRVRRGQLLARLENEDLLNQEKQSQAALEKSAAALDVEKANLQKARANLLLARKNAQRFEALAAKNLVSKLEAEQYQTAFQLAKEEVARCEAQIDAVLMEQRAGRAGLGFARSKVADTLIHAPDDGVIITRDLEKGDTVSPGASIFTVADPGTVWVKANVDESVLKGLAIGNSAVISLRSAAGESVPGRVARLGHQSDRVTEELEVDVAFARPLKTLRLGEQSDVYIVTGSRSSAPALPSASIVTRDRKRGVWVVRDGKLTFRPVSVGIEDRQHFTEILSGLSGNELVAVAPLPEMAKFREGMKVKVSR